MLPSLKSFIEYFQKVLGVEEPCWDYLQVEVTTRCQLQGCLMCPRTAWPQKWQHRDLSWQTFEALLASRKWFSQAHLSGWGEPLLHPRLWDMAHALQDQGVKVSLTTNGLALGDEMQRRALDHLDMVAISLHGARADTFETLRPGADFRKVVKNIAALCERKHSLGLGKPEVVLLFLKMRPNLEELPEFLRLAASLGVDRVDAPNLDFIPAVEMEPLHLLSPDPPPREWQAIQEEAAMEAQRLTMPFRNFSLYPHSAPRICDANPLRHAFVTVSGGVAPCVYLGLPVDGSFTRRFFNQFYQTRNYFYGRVGENSLGQLLQQPAYLNFIDYFKTPTPIFALSQPAKNHRWSAAGLGRGWPSATSPGRWPPPCRGCYKTLGF